MSKLILQLGPTRTGTTYIWRLLTDNDALFNNTPVLPSAFEKNSALNEKLIELNYQYYELIINNTATPTE